MIVGKRKQSEEKLPETKQLISLNLSSQSPRQVPQSNGIVSSKEASNSNATETGLEEPGSLEHELWMLYNSAVDRSQLDRQKLSRVAKVCILGPIEQQRLISVFERWVEHYQRLGSPRTDHVLVLVKFNVLRALISNGADLGYTAGEGVYSDAALSPFTDPSNPMWHVRSVSGALQPTNLQRQIPHHPWIDILPSPVMRDNLLLARDTYDVMELCADLVGFFSADKGRTGMVVWREPWDIAGWEVTESFVNYWGWTIQGCEQLIQSTNYWREQRGERPLQVERIVYVPRRSRMAYASDEFAHPRTAYAIRRWRTPFAN